MNREKLKSKHFRVAMIILCIAILLIIIYTLKCKQVYPIEPKFSDGEKVSLEYQYADYKGYNHSGTITDEVKINNLNTILKQIQDENPPHVKSAEERSGAVAYQFILKNGQNEFYYSLQGAYLAVGKQNLFKTCTIYELSNDSSGLLIRYFNSLDD